MADSLNSGGINDFVDFVNEEMPRRPVILRGPKYISNPNKSEYSEVINAPVGTFYINHTTEETYQKKYSEWEKVGSDIEIPDETKDVIFMLGGGLELGPQEKAEIHLPYVGTITDLIVVVGKDSRPTSNILFSLQRYTNGQWFNIYQGAIQATEEKTAFLETSIPVENDRVRINLTDGNLSRITNMSVIAKILLGG